ncbi:stability/partitioning determinant [Nitrospira sp. T9]|uniref:stability/partitioning determinant n=1 Tax=unclassified Nitrospira TaxID=2652172 RepID=UPI003F9735D2
MSKQRAEIGFDANLETLDPKEWETPKWKGSPIHPDIPKEEIRKVAEQSGFTSREGRRIHRTGRSEQLNLKVRHRDKEAFYALCDQKGWVLGETFQYALEALQRELTTTKTHTSSTATKE